MEVAFQIPDDLAGRMNASSSNLSRRALEAISLEEYIGGHITKPELRRLLGYSTRDQLDHFLSEHGVDESYTFEEIGQQVETLKLLGL